MKTLSDNIFADFTPSKPLSLPKPRGTGKKQAKKRKKPPTSKKGTTKKTPSGTLSAEVALAMLESNLNEAEHLKESLDHIRAWFTDTLGTLEQSCGAQAHLTLAFSRVVNDALEAADNTLKDDSSTDVRKEFAPFFVRAAIRNRAVLYLQQYIRSLKAGVGTRP